MRLFVAFGFSGPVLDRIWAIQGDLRQDAHSGSFTRRENLHLTLAFLGETAQNRLPALKKLLRRAAEQISPFSLTFDHLGTFSGRDREQLYYLSASAPPELSRLVGTLNAALHQEGFPVEDREFRPHVTLARRCVTETVPPVSPLTAAVCSVSLMQSERVRGVLTYTPLFEICFPNG